MTSRQNLHFSSRVNTLAPHSGLNLQEDSLPWRCQRIAMRDFGGCYRIRAICSCTKDVSVRAGGSTGGG